MEASEPTDFEQLASDDSRDHVNVDTSHECRAAAVARFLDDVQSSTDVWIARRIDIADHWRTHHPAAK